MAVGGISRYNDDLSLKGAISSNICLIEYFTVNPEVQLETIKFRPSHCIMQQVHCGVIVHSEGKKVRIEGIDLKVWR
jgi:uncharacterized Fe-S cluster-containing protein